MTENDAQNISIANFCLVSVGGVPPNISMLNPPSRLNRWTPEEALVVAAWLVALAQPMTEVKFGDILERVEST